MLTLTYIKLTNKKRSLYFLSALSLCLRHNDGVSHATTHLTLRFLSLTLWYQNPLQRDSPSPYCMYLQMFLGNLASKFISVSNLRSRQLKYMYFVNFLYISANKFANCSFCDLLRGYTWFLNTSRAIVRVEVTMPANETTKSFHLLYLSVSQRQIRPYVN